MTNLLSEETNIKCTQHGIPIRNLWLLYFYASDLYKYLDEEALHGCEKQPEGIPNLLAEVLCQQVEARILRSLTQSYQNRSHDLNRVRGKIDLLETERRQLLSKGKVHCSFHELTVDTLRNRYVVSALSLLTSLCSNKNLIGRCVGLKSRLVQMGVSITLGIRHSDIGRSGRNEIQDRKMIDVSKLVHDMSYMNESLGKHRSNNANRDEMHLRKLFEKAVGGFYKIKLRGTSWTLKAGARHKWQVENGSELFNSLLPGMETDIVLENILEDRRIIIDTKFNKLITHNRYGSETARSDYIFQLYAYLRSQERHDDSLSLSSEGVLLHPAVGSRIQESGIIQGHLVKFNTVSLDGDFLHFEQDLLAVIDTDFNSYIAH
jgi:5-methylcytosine-specific restriction enzyme subunit McrC